MRAALIIFILAFGCTNLYAQSGDFCNAVNAIMHDGPNKFRNVRGNTISANANATIWSCGIKVPGTINSRFVASMGLFYEGAFLQTKDKDALRPVYNSCEAMLDSCLIPQGYSLSRTDNFYPGLGDYKKLVYISESQEDAMPLKPPPHVTLEVAYNKDAGDYTIVMYIFEH